MSRVWSCNEWDPLEEVIVGNPLKARFPTADPSTRVAEFPDRPLEEIPQGPFPQRIIEETEEDLDAFVAVLTKLGVTVQRPETWPHEAAFSTIHWQSQGYYNYCPRDVLLVVGDQIIETPERHPQPCPGDLQLSRPADRLPEVGRALVWRPEADAPRLRCSRSISPGPRRATTSRPSTPRTSCASARISSTW